MKRISILGCGWLGRAVAIDLIRQGWIVKGSTTTESKLKSLQEDAVESFLVSLESINSAPSEFFEKTMIIAIPPGGEKNRDSYLVNMRKAADHVVANGVENVLFISSTSVYPDEPIMMSEGDEDKANFLVEAEDLFKTSDLVTTIIRFAGLIGPGRHPGKFLAGKVNLSKGNSPVNLIHQSDCVEVIRGVLEKDLWGITMNVCADQHPTRRDYYSRAAKSIGSVPPLFNDDITEGKTISANKAKQLLEVKFRDINDFAGL